MLKVLQKSGPSTALVVAPSAAVAPSSAAQHPTVTPVTPVTAEDVVQSGVLVPLPGAKGFVLRRELVALVQSQVRPRGSVTDIVAESAITTQMKKIGVERHDRCKFKGTEVGIGYQGLDPRPIIGLLLQSDNAEDQSKGQDMRVRFSSVAPGGSSGDLAAGPPQSYQAVAGHPQALPGTTYMTHAVASPPSQALGSSRWASPVVLAGGGGGGVSGGGIVPRPPGGLIPSADHGSRARNEVELLLAQSRLPYLVPGSLPQFPLPAPGAHTAALPGSGSFPLVSTASNPMLTHPNTDAARPDAEERLRKLKRALESGLITKGDYDAKKAKIIDDEF